MSLKAMKMSEDFDLLTEKAKSKSQQRLMGAVHAYQKYGTVPKNKSFAALVKSIAEGGKKKKRGKGKTKGMKKSSAKKYAETKHKGLPEKVSESFTDFLNEVDWERTDYVDRLRHAERASHDYKKELGRRMLRKIRRLGPSRRAEPTSWSHDVKRRAFHTVRDALRRRRED